MKESIELTLEADITVDKFWELVDDLFYTKVFYDADTNLYFTKNFKKQCFPKANGNNNDNDNDTFDQDDIIDLTQEEINTILVSFITIVAKYSDSLALEVGEASFFDAIAEYLVQFPYYKTHVDFCIRKMISLLFYSVELNLHNLNLNVEILDEDSKNNVNESIDTNEKFIKTIGWILYKHYRNNKVELLQSLRSYCGFSVLFQVIKNYVAISRSSHETNEFYEERYRNYLIILFDLIKSYEFKEEIKAMDRETLIFLFHGLTIQDRSENEVNFLKFRLLLALNEQYIYDCGSAIKKDVDGTAENLVFKIMLKNIKFFQVFSEILILNFNRDVDRVDQILMLKFLYVLFSNELTNNLVYVNDLKLIVDIIIRQLFNIQLKKYDYLVNIYLRVLKRMLTVTELRNTQYKLNSLIEVLEYIIASEDSTTVSKELALECLKCDVFKTDEHSKIVQKFKQLEISNNLEDKETNLAYNLNVDLKNKPENANIVRGVIQNTPGKMFNHLKQVATTPYQVAKTLHLDKMPDIFVQKKEKNTANQQALPPVTPPARLSRSSSVPRSSPSLQPVSGFSSVPSLHQQEHHLPASSMRRHLPELPRTESASKLNPECLAVNRKPPPPPRKNISYHAIGDVSKHDPNVHNGSCTPPMPPPSRGSQSRQNSVSTVNSGNAANTSFNKKIHQPLLRDLQRLNSQDSSISLSSQESAVSSTHSLPGNSIGSGISRFSSGRKNKPPPPPPPPVSSAATKVFSQSTYFISRN